LIKEESLMNDLEANKKKLAELKEQLAKLKKERIKEMEFWDESKKQKLFYVV